MQQLHVCWFHQLPERCVEIQRAIRAATTRMSNYVSLKGYGIVGLVTKLHSSGAVREVYSD